MGVASIDKWGPSAWTYLHIMSFYYPNRPRYSERQNMYLFLKSFARTIPCRTCQRDFVRMLHRDVTSSSSPHLKSTDALARVVVEWHNEVNRRLGKPTWSFEKARSHYYHGEEKTNVASPVVAATVVVLVGAAAVYVRYRRPRPRDR